MPLCRAGDSAIWASCAEWLAGWSPAAPAQLDQAVLQGLQRRLEGGGSERERMGAGYSLGRAGQVAVLLAGLSDAWAGGKQPPWRKKTPTQNQFHSLPHLFYPPTGQHVLLCSGTIRSSHPARQVSRAAAYGLAAAGDRAAVPLLQVLLHWLFPPAVTQFVIHVLAHCCCPLLIQLLANLATNADRSALAALAVGEAVRSADAALPAVAGLVAAVTAMEAGMDSHLHSETFKRPGDGSSAALTGGGGQRHSAAPSSSSSHHHHHHHLIIIIISSPRPIGANWGLLG